MAAPAIQFPARARIYHLIEIKAYIVDNGFGAVLDASAVQDIIDHMSAKLIDPVSYDPESDVRANPCGRCQTNGYYPLSQDTNNPADSGTRVHCKSCDGYGHTVEPVVPRVIWDNPVP